MSTLLISGSPRKNGNTEIFLSIFKKELQKYNIRTELITLTIHINVSWQEVKVGW